MLEPGLDEICLSFMNGVGEALIHRLERREKIGSIAKRL